MQYAQTGGDLEADSVSHTRDRSRKRQSYDPTTVSPAVPADLTGAGALVQHRSGPVLGLRLVH